MTYHLVYTCMSTTKGSLYAWNMIGSPFRGIWDHLQFKLGFLLHTLKCPWSVLCTIVLLSIWELEITFSFRRGSCSTVISFSKVCLIVLFCLPFRWFLVLDIPLDIFCISLFRWLLSEMSLFDFTYNSVYLLTEYEWKSQFIVTEVQPMPKGIAEYPVS